MTLTTVVLRDTAGTTQVESMDVRFPLLPRVGELADLSIWKEEPVPGELREIAGAGRYVVEDVTWSITPSVAGGFVASPTVALRELPQ